MSDEIDVVGYINPNPVIKLQGCCVVKNPIETDFSDYIEIPKLKGYMINLKKKCVINKISKRIQKNIINISGSKKYNRQGGTMTYDTLIKLYM